MIELKLLDPQTDLELFKEAWRWRAHKRHVGAREAVFEDVIDPDPRQTVIGVFNGQFCAMYLLYEDSPGVFNAHFSSKRGTSKELLIEAGLQIREAFMQNGAIELCAWVTVRNKALKSYLEALGFVPTERKSLAENKPEECCSLPAMKEFVKYAYSGR